MMKLGFGFYRHMLNDDYYRFAVQCGATHAVVHMCDYGRGDSDGGSDDQPLGEESGWGVAKHPEAWTVDELLAIKKDLARHGLKFHAIENFDPAQWHDVLLDGPKKLEQLEVLKEQIRNVGEAGIPVFGYNFSIAGVAARNQAETRGEAVTVGLMKANPVLEKPLPRGMVWNMTYDENAPDEDLPMISHEELWERLAVFLEALVPVAEEAGVTLAAHPDDPPLMFVRGQPRLVYRHHLYQKLLDLQPSKANQLEFCIGTLAEMQDKDLYRCVDTYSQQQKVAYVHLRNVWGKVPQYVETFIDDGDVDIKKVLEILHENGFDGVVIPDHTPQMNCAAPWHAGMAFAMGYIRAMIAQVGD